MIKFPTDYDEFQPLRCSVAAAILGGGALTAGATMWGANRAADAQTAAQGQNIAFQKLIAQQNQNNLQPFIAGGAAGIPRLTNWLNPDDASGPLNALMRLVTPGANMADTLKQTPGYQFTEDRGLRAVNNALAARGLGGSGGPVAKGAGEYVTGLASGTWQSVVNALQNLFSGGAGALQNLVSGGTNAAGGLATALNTTGGNIGNAMTGIGNALGGAATATGNAIGGFGNNVTTATILQKLLGGGGGGGGPGGGGLYGTPAVAGNPWSPGGTGDANYWGG